MNTTVAKEDFIALVEDMRVHAHNCVSSENFSFYKPSKHTQASYKKYSVTIAARGSALDKLEGEIKSIVKSKLLDAVKNARSDSLNIINDYKAELKINIEKAESDFVARMTKSKDVTKHAFSEALDIAYDKAIDKGSSLPDEQQRQLLTFMKKNLPFLINSIAQDLYDFFNNSATQLTELVKNKPEGIKEYFLYIEREVEKTFNI